jgi:hypothetical protein
MVIRHPWLTLLASLLVTALVASGARHLKVESDYEIFFDGINPRLQAHLEVEDLFGRNDYVQLALTPKDGELFTVDNMAAIQDMTERFWTLPYSRRVDSLTNYTYTFAEGDDLSTTPLFEDADLLDEQEWHKRKAFALSNVATRRVLVSDDGRVTGINTNILLPQGDSMAPMEVAAATHALVEQMQQDYPQFEMHTVGSILINEAFFLHSTSGFAKLLAIGIVLLLVSSALILRSISAAFSIGVLMFSAAAVSLGVTGWLGWPITAPSSTSSVIIMAVAVASTVHMIASFLKRLAIGATRQQAVQSAIAHNFKPIALTAVTTAIGFLCLNLSEVPPYRLLGNTTAIGVSAAFLLTFTLLPALLCLLPFRRHGNTGSVPGERWARFGDLVARQPRRMMLGSLLVMSALIIPIYKNVIDDRLLNYFDEGVPIRDDTDYVMEHFSFFYGSFMPVPSGEEGGITDPAYLRHLDDFILWARQQPEVKVATGFSDIIKQLNQNMNGDDPAFYRIPDDRELIAQYLLLYELSLPFGKDLSRDIDSARATSQARIGFHNLSSAGMREFETRAQAWMQENWPDSMQTHLAGPPLLFAHIWRDATNSNLLSMALAVILICTLIGLTMRSLKLGLVSLAPNILPTLMAFGLWGVWKGQIDIGSSIVAVIAFGIIVDDTIHFLHRYQHFRQQGEDYRGAVRKTFAAVGMALMTTTIVLVLGFGVLGVSDFTLNSSMGLLTSLTIALALVVDFIFLPALLGVVDGRKTARS